MALVPPTRSKASTLKDRHSPMPSQMPGITQSRNPSTVTSPTRKARPR